MPRVSKTVRVQPIAGEKMRFYVESWSQPQRPHLVDLLDHNGAGSCSCTDWVTRRGPAIKKGLTIGTKLTLCRHVEAAQRYFLNRLLRHMANDVR